MSVLIGILLLLVSVSSLQSMVETQLEKKFLVYENSNLGFRILYPSGWQVVVENPGRVIFSSLENSLVRIIVDNISRYLDQSTQTVRNSTAHDYALNEIKGLQGVASNIRDMVGIVSVVMIFMVRR